MRKIMSTKTRALSCRWFAGGCLFAVLTSFFPAQAGAQDQAKPVPEIVKQDGRFALMVDGAPYLILGAQCHNSSAWPAMLPKVWPAIENLHANTLEIPVYWEQFEPEQGKYDTSVVDLIIKQAREHKARLVLLWFGTWKNGSSHYIPQWAKTQPEKFPRITGKNGESVDSPSPHALAALQADVSAFSAFMRHLKEVDAERTVIMVQVENEPGSWDTVRNYSPAAEKLIAEPVPGELLAALGRTAPAGANWAAVFGPDADEYFHAWSIARYIGKVAAAGKKEYPLPMYANAALRDPLTPGPASTYESGGPTDNVLEIWKAAAPALDVLAPDIYQNDSVRYRKTLELYGRPDNALFVPETGGPVGYPRLCFAALGRGAELPNVDITGVSGYSQWGPAGWVHDNYNWHDILTWTHGKHTIETGVDVDRHHDLDHFVPPQLRPYFGFANLIDFAQDLPFSESGPTVDVATGALANDLYERIDWLYMGGFVQDDFKVTPRFTLNIGARFEYYGHWGNFHNSDTPFPMFSPGSAPTFAEQIASGSMSVRGSAQEAYVVDNRPHGISPRVGFGWDVFGNGKTALRGGYGLFYNNVADGSFSFSVRAAPPFWADPSYNIFSKPFYPFAYALGNAAGTSFPVPAGLSYQVTPAGGIAGIPVETYGVNPTVDQPRTSNWMFAIQHDFGHNLVAEADYNGSHSSHLFVQTDVNRFPGDLIQNNGTQTRLNANFGPILYGQTIGTADGQYGTLMLTKRLSHTWQLRGIFTFGKATDELSSNDNGTANSEDVLNPLNLNAQHALSDYDVGRRFTLDSVWEIPTPFKSGLAKRALGGWRMSHILILQSGLPLTVYTSAPFDPLRNSSGTIIGYAPGSGDYNADGYDYDVPNTPSFGNHISTNRSSFIKGFAPASAFPMPALGQEGNLGRNTFSGPAMANINSEFTKAFKIPWFTAEGASFEIRADIFNLFNRVNLTSPTTDLSSSLFGMSTGQNLPRSAQFGIHIGF